MTIIMILHIRSKYTAVGRKEIVMFFYLYALIEFLAIFLDSGIIQTASVPYPWFAAVYTGLVAATYTCLLINGFVGFQFAEDGTPLSLWFLRITSLGVFGIGFFLAIATFKGFAGFSFSQPIALWIIYILWPLICVVVYVVSQLVLVLRTLDDRWPLGDILFGLAFFAVAQVVLFAFSVSICDAVKHYIDRRFEELEQQRAGKGFVMTIYRRRAASSPVALRKSLERREKGLRFFAHGAAKKRPLRGSLKRTAAFL